MFHPSLEAIERTLRVFKQLSRILCVTKDGVSAKDNYTIGHPDDEDAPGLSPRNVLNWGHGVVLEWWLEIRLRNPWPAPRDSPDLFQPRVTVELNRERAFLMDAGTLLARATYWGADDGWHARTRSQGEPPLDPTVVLCPTKPGERVNTSKEAAMRMIEMMSTDALAGSGYFRESRRR